MRMTQPSAVSFLPLEGLPEVTPGMDLAPLIAAGVRALAPGCTEPVVIVLAQKIVSKAEGRLIELDSVTPSAEAQRLAQLTHKDPRLVQVVLDESEEVVRAAPQVLIVRHRLGFVVANAGVDRSNVPRAAAGERVLLLPRDPDASAAALRRQLSEQLGMALAVIITDSFGRPWRRGVTQVALGCAGLPALLDRRGERDRAGRTLEVTEVALADAIAAGAGLVMGEAAESRPVVLALGLCWSAAERPAAALLRPRQEDLFR